MLAISLMRMGAKGKPFYRLVVKERRSKRDGKYLENVGTYDPMASPADVKLNHERIQYWISVGAKPTETVASLIKHNPVMSEEEQAVAIAARAEAKAQAEQAKADAKQAEADQATKRAEFEKRRTDAQTQATSATTEKGSKKDSILMGFAKSAARSMGTAIVGVIKRGIMDTIFGGKKKR